MYKQDEMHKLTGIMWDAAFLAAQWSAVDEF
jgi:hypothetical protein